MRRFGKRMINESRNPDHYSGDTFYIKRKEPDYGIYKVEIKQSDSDIEDIIGDIYEEWIPCANLRNSSSTLDDLFNNSTAEDVVRKALESDSPDKKLYTIDWYVNTTRPWIDYDEVDLSAPEYEEFVNDFKNDEYTDVDVFDGNAIAFCDEKNIKSVVGAIQRYMEYGTCWYSIEKMELDTDEESLVESDDTSNNDSLHGFIDDGDSVIDGIVDNWADYDEIDEEDAIMELQDKANYEREEDDGMRESVMRSRLRSGRTLKEEAGLKKDVFTYETFEIDENGEEYFDSSRQSNLFYDFDEAVEAAKKEVAEQTEPTGAFVFVGEYENDKGEIWGDPEAVLSISNTRKYKADEYVGGSVRESRRFRDR